jgi:hypothetical protein
MRKSYSHSRRATLEQCPRKYFYEYYAGSFEPASVMQHDLFAALEPARFAIDATTVNAIRELKELTNAFMLAGEILHSLIATSLRKRDIGRSWFLDTAVARFDRCVTYSRDPVTHAKMLQDKYPPAHLLESYYELPDAEQTIATARERLRLSLRNFFDDPNIVRLVGEMLQGEVLVERPVSGLPKLDDFSVQGWVDFASRFEGRIRIVDWKMGESVGDEDSLQLLLYAKWALKEFQCKPEDVSVRRVFLLTGAIEEERTLNEQLVSRAEARLIQDVEWMNELDPYGREGNERAFSPCEKKNVCRQCKFQRVCPAMSEALV